MKNKKVILLLISLTLLVGIVQPGTLAVFAEESAFTCDTQSGFYAEASQPYIAPEVPTEEEPEEEQEEESEEEQEEKQAEKPVEEQAEKPVEVPVEEPAFTCDIESGFYAEASLLYAAPGVLAEEDKICTCNPSPAEGEEHQKGCPLYVEQTWQGEKAEIKYQIVGPENCGTLDNEKELLRLPVSSTETGLADENLGTSGADNLYLNGNSDMAIGSVPTAAEGFRFVGWYRDEGCTWPVEASWVSDNRLIPEKTKNYGTVDAPVMGYETATYYARFESDTADLIITKQNMDEGQSSIFDVTGPDGYSKRIVINGSSPVTIKGLKSGTYTVTEVTAWQHTAGSNSQSVTLQSSKSSTVCFTDNRSSHQWLSGNAHNRITFGN